MSLFKISGASKDPYLFTVLPSLLTKNLEKFHFSQVETAREMMLQNVASLQEIFTLLQENVDRI